MVANVLFSEGGSRIADSGEPGGSPPRSNPNSAIRNPQSEHACCASCGEPGGSCGAMPIATDDRDVTLRCAWCFLMPLVVLIAAVAALHDAVGDATACLIGAAAWLGVVQVGNFLSRRIRRHRSGNERY